MWRRPAGSASSSCVAATTRGRTVLLEALTIYDQTGRLPTRSRCGASLPLRSPPWATAARAGWAATRAASRRFRRAPPVYARASPRARRPGSAAQHPREATLYTRRAAVPASGRPAGRSGSAQGRANFSRTRGDTAPDVARGALRTEVAPGTARRRVDAAVAGRGRAGAGDTTAARAARTSDGRSERLAIPSGPAASRAGGARSRAGCRPRRSRSIGRARAAGDKIAPEIAWRLHAGLGLARRAEVGTTKPFASCARRWSRSSAEPVAGTGGAALGVSGGQVDVYAQLALIERSRSRPEAAFEASERLRARDARAALARPGGSTATRPPTSSRGADLRRRIGELTDGSARPASTRSAAGGVPVAARPAKR